jgi:hypothetical protein
MKTRNQAANDDGSAGFADATGSAHCVRYGCWGMPMKHMKRGESHQTGNGFFTIQITGWYCPRCGAGYGGGQ